MALQEQQDFEIIRDLIWETSGIYFESTKRQYFLRRLRNRMRLLGCQRLKDYYRILRYEAPEAELSELLNLLTTTETYFFRNGPQLRSFQEEILPEIIQRKQQTGQYHLHFWSAGCSSGEEAYTIAMLLLETLPKAQQWKINIVGTDINTQVLAKAQDGLYSSRSLRETSEEYVAKYFQQEGDQYRMCDRVKKMATFRRGNLIQMEDSSLIQNVDCIFCRNVLIYFNLDSCRQVMNIFYDNLARNGYLLLGHSESLYRITAIFTLKKLQHSLVYHKE
ncbi:MAG: protein-glutamate O-methyltransferase CheR [bacterium]|nr:protein-glutamate O-methyltransferase CheR [bacterium]